MLVERLYGFGIGAGYDLIEDVGGFALAITQNYERVDRELGLPAERFGKLAHLGDLPGDAFDRVAVHKVPIRLPRCELSRCERVAALKNIDRTLGPRIEDEF